MRFLQDWQHYSKFPCGFCISTAAVRECHSLFCSFGQRSDSFIAKPISFRIPITVCLTAQQAGAYRRRGLEDRAGCLGGTLVRKEQKGTGMGRALFSHQSGRKDCAWMNGTTDTPCHTPLAKMFCCAFFTSSLSHFCVIPIYCGFFVLKGMWREGARYLYCQSGEGLRSGYLLPPSRES